MFFFGLILAIVRSGHSKCLMGWRSATSYRSFEFRHKADAGPHGDGQSSPVRIFSTEYQHYEREYRQGPLQVNDSNKLHHKRFVVYGVADSSRIRRDQFRSAEQ
jgi:hypothetical protein